MPIFSDVVIAIGVFAILGERVSQVVLSAFLTGDSETVKKQKQAAGLILTLALGLVAAFALDLQFMGQLLNEVEFTTNQDRVVTGLLIGSGSAPAHEVLKYITEKKNKAKADRKAAENA